MQAAPSRLFRHLASGLIHKPCRIAQRLLFMAAVIWGLAACGETKAPQTPFVLLDGSTQTIAHWRGKVVLINFWATSCASCVEEMPQLVQLYQDYANKGYGTIAVAMKDDPPAYVVNFAKQRQLLFAVAIDNTGQVAKDWENVSVTPSSFLIDKRGVIVKRYIGPPDFAALRKEIEALLAQPA